jgi:UDP-N-acetylmuramoyl-L-alanyl-D-glutamate--2,6-diaminopimelate ligase
MTLRDLLKGIDILAANTDLDAEVNCPRYDSRAVTPNDVFVAIPGFELDGTSFIPDAMAKGAAACVVQSGAPEGVPYVLVRSARSALALMSANYFGRPAERLKVIGVTGTNGKTTTTYLLKSVLEIALGAKVGLIGTLGNLIGGEELPSDRTTPESFDLQQLFSRMTRAGCEYAVMEVSSHALALDRVASIPFEAGIFTNLTQDHLDFHKTMQNYLEAKSLLFSMCKAGIINADDPACEYLLSHSSSRNVTFSPSGGPADYRAVSSDLNSGGVRYLAETPRGSAWTQVKIPASFTIENSLAVIACCCELGVPLDRVVSALGIAKGVPGRVEVVPGALDFTVLIDYAHTPDALENILTAARKVTSGRVTVLFGCGGDRDKTKRPIMGDIGVRLSDYAYITSDNPRTEDPQAIIDDILAGVHAPPDRYTVICNRREAIKRAVCEARAGDVLILAGKGHETYQILGKEKTHLDEREEVSAALELRYKKHGTDVSV